MISRLVELLACSSYSDYSRYSLTCGIDSSDQHISAPSTVTTGSRVMRKIHVSAITSQSEDQPFLAQAAKSRKAD